MEQQPRLLRIVTEQHQQGPTREKVAPLIAEQATRPPQASCGLRAWFGWLVGHQPTHT
jgi:hypothetical protein